MVREVEPVKRLDIASRDYAFALGRAALTRERERAGVEARVERLWREGVGANGGPAATPLTALSVRTGFDACLRCLRLERGSEVLMSAVTIPDMVKIVEGHGLVPVAIDIDYDTLSPRLEALEAELSSRTRVVVVSHVFGSVSDNMREINQWAHRHGLFVVEDCAEAYCGLEYRGDPDSDISLFSFGSIKTETALGGATMRVRDAHLAGEMRGVLDHYPVQPLSVFSKRVAKYAVFSMVLNRPKLYSLFVDGLAATGRSHLDVLLANTRGFINQDLFEGIRLRPPVALLQLLERRLLNFDEAKLERRRSRCRLAMRLLQNVDGVMVPGTRAAPHHFWLFPVNVDDPDFVAREMLRAGFDATTGTTSLMCVDDVVTEYAGGYREGPMVSSALMRDMLYLPLDADTPKHKVYDMIDALEGAVLASGSGGAPRARL